MCKTDCFNIWNVVQNLKFQNVLDLWNISKQSKNLKTQNDFKALTF